MHSSWTDGDTTLDDSRRSTAFLRSSARSSVSSASRDEADDFCADADFAEAVVRAAERDGLTVINGSVHSQGKALLYPIYNIFYTRFYMSL